MNGSCTNGRLMIRGRIIGETEIGEVRRIASEYAEGSRARIVRELCLLWDWKQTNGALKLRACYEVLNRLEARGLVELPTRRKQANRARGKAKRTNRVVQVLSENVKRAKLQEQMPLSVTRVDTAVQHMQWVEMMDKYHYLGSCSMVGASMRYLVHNCHGELLAASGWQSAVGHLETRDVLVGWDTQQRARYLEHVANNVRFLMIPWIQVPNAASSIMARVIQCLRRDWQERYGVDLWLLESFVDRNRFSGICYRASNWVAIGWTKGYEKREGQFAYHGKKKEVYVYVLNRRMRREIFDDVRQPILTREFLLSMPWNKKELERRAKVKKCEKWEAKLPPEFELREEDIASMGDELAAFHQIFLPAFGRIELCSLSLQYLQGLMSAVDRKNIEAMALHLEGPQSVRGLQRFMSQYKWNHDMLSVLLEEESSKTLNSDDGVLSVDASETGKKGTESVGVAHQYCGNLGKVANCQSGVYLCYANKDGHILIKSQLYMPEIWFSDQYSERWKKCYVPEDLEFKTKPQIASELISQVHESGQFHFKWITMDASFGNNEELLGTLPAGMKYIADISSSRKLWLKSDTSASSLEVKACTAEEVVGIPNLLDWQHCKIAEGSKGPTVYDFARLRVYICDDYKPENERWLWLRNAPDGQIKYALSNAPETEPFDEMMRVSSYRWPIERSFQEGKGELGMDHYEHRSWHAWHRHMLMVALAQLFLLRFRLKYKKSTGIDSASVL